MFNKALAWSFPTLGAERARAAWEIQDSVLHVHRLREPAQEVPDPEPLQKGQFGGTRVASLCTEIKLFFTRGETVHLKASKIVVESCWATPLYALLHISSCDIAIQYALVTVTKSVRANLFQLQLI